MKYLLGGENEKMCIRDRYQITIMIAIVGTVGITTSIFTSLAYKAFFNKREQILF